MEEDCPTWAVEIKIRLAKVETDIRWLKRSYWLQSGISLTVGISILITLLSFIGVI